MTRLGEIRARLEAATPGEWRETMGAKFDKWMTTTPGYFVDIAGPGTLLGKDEDQTWGDAALIAHAPEDLRLLLAVAEAAKDVCEATSPRELPPLISNLTAAFAALDNAPSSDRSA